eukprot:596053_1
MSFRNRTNKLDPGIELYEDSTSESDDEYTSTNDIRCLETDYHCFSASESIIIEVSMILSYLFMILFITCVLSSAMITSKHNYFSLSVSGIAASAITGCISFCIYQRYEMRLMNNFISDSVQCFRCVFCILVTQQQMCKDNHKFMLFMHILV